MSNETEAEILTRIEQEHFAIAGDQFFREGLFAVVQKVQTGLCDKFVFEVGAELYESFKRDHPMTTGRKKEVPPVEK